MIDTIYVESEIQDTKECKKILARHTCARIHVIESYTEIFNQKKQPKIDPS